MDDAHVQYARFREVLELPIEQAARKANLSTEQAKSLETSERWPALQDEAKDVAGMRLASRQALFDAVAGDNEDLPEHTRLKAAQWLLARVDEEFMSPEFREAAVRDEENPLQDLSDEDLRELQEEEQVVLNVD